MQKIDPKIAYDDFCRNERDLYCISSATGTTNIDSLTFRKAADNKRQILAWSRYEEAESWRIENKLAASKVVSLTFTELRSQLMEMAVENRKIYCLEVI